MPGEVWAVVNDRENILPGEEYLSHRYNAVTKNYLTAQLLVHGGGMDGGFMGMILL
jgi:hypothetical protein